uniref:Uncharacterized protein n=1 Tax=Anopheles dirus TaxID=7168 RepID=A0A182NKQ6_9DIPT
MKAKVAKKEETAGKKLLAIKKSKTDIKKVKKPKSEVKPTTAKVAAAGAVAGAAAPLTFAEKKVLSVKRKANQVAETKTIKAPKPAKPAAAAATAAVVVTKPLGKKAKRAKKTAEKAPVPAKPDVQENKPPAKRDRSKKKKNEKKPAEETSAPAKPDGQENKPPAKGDGSKKKRIEKKPAVPVTTANKRKAQLKAAKKQEQAEAGEVPKEPTEEALALVPKELVTKETLTKCFKVLHKQVSEGADKLFGGEMLYGLQITAVKVPKCPYRNRRITLPHSLVHEDDEICLIVKDLIRGRKVDFDGTLHHWQDKLNELGIKEKVAVIPFQQLKQDYNTFEMRRKLVNRYQRFLADARISGHVFTFLGSEFATRCKNPIPVKLEDEANVKQAIEKALLVQTYTQGNSGHSTIIKFAAQWMRTEQVIENGLALLELLKTVFPGGWLNIQSLHLTTTAEKMKTLPLYFSMIDPNLVPVPVVVGPREKFIKKQQYLLAKRTGGKYEVTKDGIVRKVRPPKEDGQPDESDEEIVLDEYEQEEDDNWLPYDVEPSRRRRAGGGRPRRTVQQNLDQMAQFTVKLQCRALLTAVWLTYISAHSPPVLIDKRLVLSSVYDAIRGNSIDPANGADSRNKRNVRYYTYDDPQNDDLFPGYGEIVHPPQGPGSSSVKLCKPEPPPAVQSISISDHTWSGIGTSIIHVLKYLIAGLAVLTLPVLLLQAFVLPLKILMGLKSVAVANTLVLGTFLWKYLNRNRLRDDDEDDDGDEQPGAVGTTTGTGDGGGNGVLNGNDNRFFPFRAEDFENMTEEEIKTALKLLLKRNKRW